MKLRRLIAIYELFSAACGALLAVRMLGAGPGFSNQLTALTIVAFALVAGLAGVLLWLGSPIGYRLGVAGEALRVLRFATPWLSYYAFTGLDLNLGLQYFAHGISGIGASAQGGGLWLQANVVALFQFAILREPPFWGIGVNLVGVAVLWGLERVRRHGSVAAELTQAQGSSAAAV